MEAITKAVGFFVIFIVLVVGASLLSALPTMWAVNYLFTPQALHSVFGVWQFDFWHALMLDILSGLMFKSGTSSSESSK